MYRFGYTDYFGTGTSRGFDHKSIIVYQLVKAYHVVSLPDRYCREGSDIDVFHVTDYQYLVAVYREVDVVPLQEVDNLFHQLLLFLLVPELLGQRSTLCLWSYTAV